MTAKRKLSCSQCQHTLLVAMTQAGDSISCVCGHQVLVPTMRELRTLPVDESSPTAPPSSSASWSPLQGLLFVVGCLLVVAGLYGHVRLSAQRDRLDIQPPAFPEMPIDVQSISPSQAWEAWEYFQSEKLESRLPPLYIANRQRHRALSYYLYGAWAASALGLAMVASAFLPFTATRPSR